MSSIDQDLETQSKNVTCEDYGVLSFLEFHIQVQILQSLHPSLINYKHVEVNQALGKGGGSGRASKARPLKGQC